MPFELPFLNGSETEVEKLQNQIDSDRRYQRAPNEARQKKRELLEHDLNKLMNINHALKMENLELAQLAFDTEQKSKTAYNVLYGQSRTARRWSEYVSTSEEKRKMADVVLKTLNILNGKPAHESTTEI